MSDWRRVYEAKKSTSDAALGCLQSHQRVFIHMAACAPQALIEALCRRLKALRGVEVLHCINIGPAPYTAPEYAPHCRHNALFVAGNVRQAVQQGRADSIPIFLHEMERMFTEAILPLDVALIQLTPPDESGHMSLGTSVDISLTAARTARHVIAQVNPRMPRTFGDSFLTVDDVEAFVEEERPMPELAPDEITATQREIARHVAALSPDEATLQIGIGGIPFLFPLLYQVGLGFTPIQSGLMLMPQAVASMSMKFAMPKILSRIGYRGVLVSNTVILGLLITLFATIGLDTPVALIVMQTFCFGFFTSLQYTSMNTLVYADVGAEQTSSASTIASTMQQMSISFGVASASLVTAFFVPDRFHSSAPEIIHGIHRAFLVLGALTILSTIVFAGLKKGDGDSVSQGDALHHSDR